MQNKKKKISGDYTKVEEILIKAGWSKNRDITSQIQHAPLYKLFPKKIIEFITVFGGLQISRTPSIEQIDVMGVDYLENTIIADFYKTNIFNASKDIDVTNEDDEYYFSVLLGTQIYFVGQLRENCSLFMDGDGRFYIHTFIPDFFFIADNAFDTFQKIFFGPNDAVILQETTLEWIPSLGKELPADPLPLNKKLLKNPWNF
ncbi:SUKH-3 domain-containing protein [Flavobacterium hungaricum]|uniref:SUKH-3 immunity protein n=1 Tax=Flavobacterium hungaricum TaxID=2082725 RepID=A0ABR9TGL8_9FLAO|nr:SUKH-3 domain-containing protein [Flavobacterium hungaricum]MBE8723984.1 hypothetical protein [Flavobacterium hungaricum]